MSIAPSNIERWEEGDTQPQTKFNIMATSHNLWVSGKVLSRTTDAQPGSPAEGDAYIITGSASGAAWAGFTENYVAQYLDSSWLEYAPIGAVRVYVADEGVDVRWSGSAWATPTSATDFDDSTFRISDNSDTSKKIAFQASGITTSTVRTITMPDADVTLGELEGTSVKSTGEAGGTKFLREDGDGTCSWQTVSAGSIEGTAVLSTGPVTDGYVLTADGAGGAAWEAASGGSGAMSLLGTATVSGSAATTLTLGSLDLSSYTAFKVIFKLKNATGSISSISLYYNADTTASNYYRQVLVGTGTSAAAARANNAILFDVPANELADGNIQITLDVDGKARSFSSATAGYSGIALRLGGNSWTTAANVTSITLSGSVASSLDVGSTFSVYGIT